jgi:hypothetical protein
MKWQLTFNGLHGYIREDRTLHSNCCENLKSCILKMIIVRNAEMFNLKKENTLGITQLMSWGLGSVLPLDVISLNSHAWFLSS